MPFSPNTPDPINPTAVGQSGNLTILQRLAGAVAELREAGLLIGNDLSTSGGGVGGGNGGGASLALSNPVSLITGRSAPKSVLCCQDNAAVYDATSNKTFLSYLGVDRALFVKEFDHATQVWSDDVFVAAYPTLVGIEDDHGTPSLTVMPNGRLLVVYGAHQSAPILATSTVARSVTGGWASVTGPAVVTGTYHALATVGSSVYCLFRAGSGHNGSSSAAETYPSHAFAGLARSTDNGASWTNVGPIIDCNAYNAPSVDAGKDFYHSGLKAQGGFLHIVWSIAHGPAHDGPRADAYHVKYEASTGKLFSQDGTDLGTSVNSRGKLDSCLVMNADASQGIRFLVEADGTVVGACGAQTTDDQVGLYFVRRKPTDTLWTVRDTGARRHYAFADHHIARKEGGGYVIYAPTGREGEAIVLKNTLEKVSYSGVGHDLTAISTLDGGATFTATQVMSRWQTPGQGISGVTCPDNAQSNLSAIAVCGSVSGGLSGGLPTDRLPLYGISQTTANIDAVLAASNVSTKSVLYINRAQFFENATKPAVGTWQTIDLKQYVPFNATRVLVTVDHRGNGTAGRCVMTFRRAGTNRDADATFSRDGAGVRENSQVWVPLGPDRTFQWSIEQDGSAAFGLVYMGIVAIETEGGGGAGSKGRSYVLAPPVVAKFTPPGSTPAPSAMTLSALASSDGTGKVTVTPAGASGYTAYSLYLGSNASGTLLTTTFGAYTYQGTVGTAASFYAVASNLGGNVSATAGPVTPSIPVPGQRPTAPPTTGATFWARADQVVPQTDGATLTSWPVAAGNTLDVNTNNAGTAPTIVANGLAAKPVVRFTAASKNKMWTFSNSLPVARYRTFYVVARVRTLGVNLLHGVASTDAAATLATRIQVTAGGALLAAAFGGSGSTNSVTADGLIAANTWHIYAVTFDGNPYAPRVYLDGVAGTAGVGDSTTTPSPSLTYLALGGYGTGYNDIDYAEVVGFDVLHTAAERKSWEGYLSTAHNLPVTA